MINQVAGHIGKIPATKFRANIAGYKSSSGEWYITSCHLKGTPLCPNKECDGISYCSKRAQTSSK